MVSIALTLIFTFGLSRLLLYVIPNSVAARTKIILANLGSVLLIATIYVALLATERDMMGFLLIAVPIAAACQALWYWRDVSKISILFRVGRRSVKQTWTFPTDVSANYSTRREGSKGTE